MRRKSGRVLHHVVTSLKVAALVTVLGTVVLAAERHLARQVSPEEVSATDLAPSFGAVASTPKTAAPRLNPEPQDYFPSQFDETKGKMEDQPAAF
jgi:hypothetical protein